METIAADKSFRSFQDPDLAQQFERDGYVVLPILTESDVEEVNNIYTSFGTKFTNTWHTDMYSDDISYRRAVFEKVGAIFEARLRPILDGYRVCCGNFVVKEPSAYSAVPLHQDWTIVDPALDRSINVICPLIETTAVNGQLCVVPGSHHPPSRISFGPVDQILLDDVLPTIKSKYLRPLHQKPGEALIYDGRVLHSSEANLSDSVRICFSAGLVPNKSALRHYYKDPEDPMVIEVYEVDDEFFWQHRLGVRPEGRKLLGKYKHENIPINLDAVEAWARGTKQAD